MKNAYRLIALLFVFVTIANGFAQNQASRLECSWVPGSQYLNVEIIDNGDHTRFTNISQTKVTFTEKSGKCVAGLYQDLAVGKSITLLACGARYSSDVTCYAMPASEYVYGKCPNPFRAKNPN